MSGILTQEQFDDLVELWSSDHILGIESLFDISLTDQQKLLVNSCNNQTARVAVSSCTGSGKTAVLSMLTLLYLMVLPDCRILITAPSSNHLERVFRSEIDKWYKRMPQQIRNMYDMTQRKIEYNSGKYVHFASLVTASVENVENLAGGHSESYVILADEASGISEEAFDILLGTLSTGKGGRFIQVSNPQRSSGRFYEIFQRDLGSWVKIFFSAFDSPNVNSQWIQEMEDVYGADSDIYRMRVLGQFPRVGVSQFISADDVERALKNKLDLRAYNNFPRLMGVDVARFGDDITCLVIRQGPKLLDMKTYRGLDTMEVASRVSEFQAIHKASRIFIDSIGVGAGTADRLRDLKLPVKDVVVSNKSSDPNTYSNLRAQLWGKMREWLSSGGADLSIEAYDKDSPLASQLVSMEYGYNNKMQIQLMSKKDLKRMGHASPDCADALSFTFADAVFDSKPRSRARKVIGVSKYLWV